MTLSEEFKTFAQEGVDQFLEQFTVSSNELIHTEQGILSDHPQDFNLGWALGFLEGSGSDGRIIVNAGKISYREFFEMIAQNFERRPPFVRVSRTLMTLAIYLGKLKSITLGKTALITRETARSSLRKILYDNTKITGELNVSFTPLEDTVKWICGHFKTEAYSSK